MQLCTLQLLLLWQSSVSTHTPQIRSPLHVHATGHRQGIVQADGTVQVNSSGVLMWPVSLEEEEAEMHDDLASCYRDTSAERVTCIRPSGNVTPYKCDEAVEKVCCNPSMRKAVLDSCLQRECPTVEEAPLCDDKGFCTKACKANCCCAWTFLITLSWRIFSTAVVSVFALLQLFMPDIEAERQKNSTSTAEQEAELFMTGLGKDLRNLWFILLCWGLLGSWIYTRLRKKLREFRGRFKEAQLGGRKLDEKEFIASQEGKARKGFQIPVEQKKDAKDPEELPLEKRYQEYITEKEEEGLGGVQRQLITETTGMGQFQWLKTQIFSLSLYACIQTQAAETNVCVLGTSGRLLVVKRSPITSPKEAAKALSRAGSVLWVAMSYVLIFFRTVEYGLKTAKKFGTESMKKNAEDSPLAFVEGRTWLFTLATGVLLWSVMFTVFKLTMKTWGHNAIKNYYESDDACCLQYFRSGEKAAPLVQPRREGGLRMYFELYPLKEVFQELGKGYSYLKVMEPLAKLPSELDTVNGMPASGSGTPPDGAKKASNLTKWLGLANSVLGVLGMVFFAINIFNLFTNVANCPVSAVVKPCIERGQCGAVVKSPWFQWYLIQQGYLSREQAALGTTSSTDPLKDIAKWTNSATEGLAKEQVVKAAQESCIEMYRSLIVAPNFTENGLFSDVMGVEHAVRYMKVVSAENLNLTWDAGNLNCESCTKCMMRFWLMKWENLVEIIEILMLGGATYVGKVVARLLGTTTDDTPVISLEFAQEPGVAQNFTIPELEVQCLAMGAATFFYRYNNGIPDHMAETEEALAASVEEQNETNKSGKKMPQQPDPWVYDDTAKSWDQYNIFNTGSVNTFRVNRTLLGLLQGEEVVAAWTVPEMIGEDDRWLLQWTSTVFIIFPIIVTATWGKPLCAIEIVIGIVIEYFIYDIMIARRRAQAGILVTSRRIFQITKTPSVPSFKGRTEPLIKLDVLIHNCELQYASLQMETAVPVIRRLIFRLLKIPVTRRGQVIAQGPSGIFKIVRERGDTFQLMRHLSRISSASPVPSLEPALGEALMHEEKVEGLHINPDPCCAWCCCPRSPPVDGTQVAAANIFDRYVTRMEGEDDVYFRQLTSRPDTPKDLLCGRGCFRCACECCPCCVLDEMITELAVTTHRTLIEQRVSQRYCRCCTCAGPCPGCCRPIPNVRCTYLAHKKAAAYLIDTPSRTLTMSKMACDLSLKILQDFTREFQPGLMLHQKPYLTYSKAQLPFKDKTWVANLNFIFDRVTQKTAPSAESDDDDDFEELDEDFF